MTNIPNFLTPHIKAIYLAVFFSTAILCFSCSTSLPKGEISLSGERKGFTPDVDLASHKPYDVEIHKALLPNGPGYSVSFYRKENGKLTNHYGFWGPEEDFDKASYAWLNDSTVSIRLFNSKTQKEAKFKIFGYGSTNGISTDE